MKILITGGSGRIGYQLFKSLKNEYEVYPTFLKSNISNDMKWFHLDITNRNDTLNFIQEINPDLVIHSAALANVDLCETDHKLADSINIQGTRNVVDACTNNNCKIIYVSTSFVFNGTKSSYNEEDDYAPATYYGHSKYVGEKVIRNSDLKYLILRTDQPYGWHESWQKGNSVTRILKNFEEGKEINDVIDWYNTPTLIDDFVNATKILIKKKYDGIFHVVGPDFLNRFEWAKITAEVFNKDKERIKPIKGNALNLPAIRSNVNLNNKKLVDIGIKMNGVREGLIHMLKNKT